MSALDKIWIEPEHARAMQDEPDEINAEFFQCYVPIALIAEAVAREREVMLGNIIHDLTHAITHAVWAEYRNSIDEKYVFRKEHVENAIRQAAAIRARGQG